jgi:uncharacterized membrane protein
MNGSLPANRNLGYPMYGNVGVVERCASVAAGVALIAYGITRRSLKKHCLTAVGILLVYRGATARCPVYSKLGITRGPFRSNSRVALSGDRGIHVRESVCIEKPIDELYRFWRAFDNLPRFMTHLESVTDLGNGRSRWVAQGPAGRLVEWEAEVINAVENQVIGWRSLPNADVVSAGSVNFDAVHGGRATQVTVHLQYAPVAGRLGGLAAAIVGREPSQTIREDLRHLKQLLEAGEVPTTGRRTSAVGRRS